jgi:hypothetical protein
MKKLLLVSLCFLMLCQTQVLCTKSYCYWYGCGQGRRIAASWANVKIKGTVIGTQTNANGKYSISVPANGTTGIYIYWLQNHSR